MRQLKITKKITNRESESLERYLQEISRIDLLNMEEEVELTRKIRKGDSDALEKLAKANLRFVVSVAKQYQNQGLGLSDLINEGNLGLIKAAERFDETRGFKFISYAVWWIRQSILQAIAEQSRIVRLPLNKVSTLNRVNKAFVQLEQEFEREPTPDELAMLLDLQVEDIEETLGIAGRHVSMDAPIASSDGASSLIDIIENKEAESADLRLSHAESLRNEIERSLSGLPPKFSEIIKMYFGIGYDEPVSTEEIGVRFNLTKERVRQIKDKAIERLKVTARCKHLKAFLCR